MTPALRSALRDLRRSPGYTIAAVATLSLAIAANAAVFGAVDTVLLHPDAIQETSDLFVAWKIDSARNQPAVEITYRQFERWEDANPAVSAAAAFGSSHWPMVWDGVEEPVRLSASAVSTSFFDVLGVRPRLGRAFVGDDSLKSGWVAILSHRTWVAHFGARASVIGATTRLDGKLFTIVGVMPEDFDFPRGADLWTPVVPVLAESSSQWKVDALEYVGVLYVLGRLAPGATLQTVREQLDQRSADSPGSERRAAVVPMREYAFGPVRTGLWWLLGGVAILLLVACANLSGLSLTRALAQRQQDAVRLALGAPRVALALRWLTQSALLAGAGTVLGLAVSTWLMSAIVALSPDDVPRLAQIGISARVVSFALALACVSVALCGIAPVLACMSTDTTSVVAHAPGATTGRSSLRLRAALTGAQICLAIVVLIAAGLIVRSFLNLQRVDLGFFPQSVLTMHVAPGGATEPGGHWIGDVSRRVEALPGVENAGAVFVRPLAYREVGSGMTVILEGQPPTPEVARRNPVVNYQSATAGYFRAMRIPLLRGRPFTSSDLSSAAPVVLVSEGAARALWPGEDPIGKRLSIPSRRIAEGAVWQEVVGIVGDVHYRGIGRPLLDVYEPATQSDPQPAFLTVRTSTPPLSLVAAVHAAIRDADPKSVISGITTMEAVIARELAPWRLTGWMLALLAAFTFFLAVLGLLSQVAIDVTQRAREFAIRAAVGAESRHIHGLILARAGSAALLGTALGVVAAAAATRSLGAMLVDVSATDPVTWGLVVGATLTIVLGVSYAMARRASRTDPASLLRAE